MPSKHQPAGGRHGRIEAQMQRVLAELIAAEVKDPRVGNVTITGVRSPRDLATAKIFFVPFAGATNRRRSPRGSPARGGFLRGAGRAASWGCATRRD